MTLKCLIVDDEPLARKVLVKFIHDLPGLEVAAECANAFKAMEYLRESAVDLMFLDINMPRLSGMSMLRTLRHPPLVIITTAYQEYAVEGYELDIVDYLMKPFTFERFLKAVEKAQDRLHRPVPPPAAPADEQTTPAPFIFVHLDKQEVRVDLDAIDYVEAVGDYVKIHTQGRVLMPNLSLKHMEGLLPSAQFARIHKSYMVALGRITAVEGNMVYLQGQTLPIGKTYRPAFMALLKSHP